MASTVILVGVGGFGESHLRNIRRLQQTGHVRPIGLVDPVVKAKTRSDPSFVAPDDAPLYDTLAQAIEAVGAPDIVIVSVPIHLHAPITKEALLAGADVLLEKPPFARLDDFEAVLALEKQTGRVVQVGFQSLGSEALDAFKSGEIDIGQIRSVRAMGTWLRRQWYWKRSPWVGRRSIGDVEAMDGVATNALAHAVVTALHVAGVKTLEEVKQVEVEMYRANMIDADDTTSMRITPVNGPKVSAALTLCAAEQTLPTVEVVGDKGTATFQYTTDDVTWGEKTEHFERVDLLQNLVEHRRNGTSLRLPLRDTGGFMRVVEAIRTGGEPVHIEKKWVETRDEGTEAHPVVKDVEKWIRVASDVDGLFSEVGAPWSFASRDHKLAEGTFDGHTILEILDGAGTTPSSTPRPYIHPVRTLSGIELTATHPADHDWHCGLGFAVPDVDGTSFWGGGTFIKGQGYVMLDNHGRMTNERSEHVDDGSGLDQTLGWINHSGQKVISELRSLRWSRLSGGVATPANGWELAYRSSLTALDKPASLGSPGSNGRPNGGYGGFFWRLPRCSDVSIMSAEADGEDAVHGKVSEWLAWSGRFEARPGATGHATLVFVAEKDAAADPWVVRYAGYPGIGSAVAWEERVNIPAGSTISRGFRVGVVDGQLDREGAGKVAAALKARTSR